MSYALPFKFGNRILELGGGERPLVISGMIVTNMDVRQVQGVDIVRNLEEDFSDVGQFDGLFSQYLIEHISWRKLGIFLKSCYNALKPDTYAVFVMPDTEEQMKLVLTKPEWDLGVSQMIFGDQNYGDNAHKSAFSKSLVTKLLKDAGFESVKITPHPDPNARDMFVEAYKGVASMQTSDGLVKWNFGSFTVMFKDGWINADVIDLGEYAAKNGFIFKQVDCSKPLPIVDNSVDYINSDHMLEHLTRADGARFLSECLRILKPNGAIRIGVPDERVIAEKYVNGDIMQWSGLNEGVRDAEDEADAFYNLSNVGHLTFYDSQSVLKMLVKVGFARGCQVIHGASGFKELESLDERFPELTSYVEAIKGELPKSELQRYLSDEVKEGMQ